MSKYEDVIRYFEFIKKRYGKNLGLDDFQLRIDEYAFKSPQANSFVIQIPLKFIELVELNCHLILGNRNLFKEIGKSQGEHLDKESFKINESILTCDDFMKLNNLTDEQIKILPNDDTRKAFASYLTQIILSFVTFHELGHVRQCNAPANINLSNYIEFGSNNTNIFEQQAAETDADVFGINFFCDTLFSIMDNWGLNPMSPIFKTKEELLKTAIYSLLLFFFLSNSEDRIYNDHKQHPHPLVRVTYCMNYFQEKCLLNNKIKSKEEFADLMLSVIKEFDSTLYFHFGIPERHHYYNRFKDPDVKKTTSIIKENILKDESLNFNRPYDLLGV